MMNFIVLTLSFMTATLLSSVVLTALLLNTKVCDWLMRKAYAQAMRTAEKLLEDYDSE